MNIHYDDGDNECLDMTQEVWKYTDTIPATSSKLSQPLELTSNESNVLSSMLKHFGNKPFLRHHAQGFEQYPLVNSYKAEEENFR